MLPDRPSSSASDASLFEPEDEDSDDSENGSDTTIRFTSYRVLWLAADRYGTSNREEAALVNAFQLEIGKITENDISQVVDPKRVGEARHSVRKEQAGRRANDIGEGVRALYFEGRKDNRD